jgi:hypothetical protein
MIEPDTRTRATWGDRSDRRPRMRLLNFNAVNKGSLRGFATVALPNGLTIFDCPVMIGKRGPWATLPAKPVLDGEGRHIKPEGRKGQYAPVAQWRDKEQSTRFSDSLVALVLEAYPNAIE